MNSQEQREPRPVGNEQTAWVRLLKRARNAETRNRALLRQLAALETQITALENRNTR